MYSPAEADRRIESFNATLRAELGLTEADVRDIELSTRSPSVPTLAVTAFGVVGTR